MELPQTRVILAKLSGVYDHANTMTCIPQQCYEIMSSNNCSCLDKLNATTCTKYEADPKIPVILWSFFATIVGILLLELLAIR